MKLEFSGEEPRAKRKVLKIYTIVDKPNSPKGIWLEIGVASENRDGSISGKLDCLPVNGAIQVRNWEPREKNGFKRNDDRQQPQDKWQNRRGD